MKSFIWKHKIIFLLLFILLYFILGTMAPFLNYQKISSHTVSSFDAKSFRQKTAGCDRVGILETNDSAWEERMRLLNRAKERIILTTFDMRPGESTKDILSVILHKAEEGVKVQILVDGVSGAVRMEGQELFYALSSHPNVEIKLYNALNLFLPWKLQGRMHDKYVLVDEEAYILGGRNTFDYFIGTYTDKNVSHDREVLVFNTEPGNQNSSLYELEQYFEGIWNQKECTYFHNQEKLAENQKVMEQRVMLQERYSQLVEDWPDLFCSDWDYRECTYEAGCIRLLSNPTHIYGKEPVVFYDLVQLMKTAQERIIIQTPYIVCNSYMCEQLSSLTEVVPDMKILLNSVENGDNFVASSDYLRNKKSIVDMGIPLYEYDGGISLHGKSILIDHDLSVIGSYNLDLRSSYVDTELMLVIESEGLNQELESYLNDMEKDSRKVLDENTYEIPEHLIMQKAPLWKWMAWSVFGFVLQPFRGIV